MQVPGVASCADAFTSSSFNMFFGLFLGAWELFRCTQRKNSAHRGGVIPMVVNSGWTELASSASAGRF